MKKLGFYLGDVGSACSWFAGFIVKIFSMFERVLHFAFSENMYCGLDMNDAEEGKTEAV